MTRARDLANIIGPNGDLVVTGDLQVSGTTTTVNSTTVEIADKNILLGSGATANSQNSGAGLSVLLPDASPDEFATILWDATGTKFDFSHGASFLGNVYSGTLIINPQDGISEGGEIILSGAGSNEDIYIDNYAGTFRIFDPFSPTIRLTINSSGDATLTGNLNISPNTLKPWISYHRGVDFGGDATPTYPYGSLSARVDYTELSNNFYSNASAVDIIANGAASPGLYASRFYQSNGGFAFQRSSNQATSDDTAVTSWINALTIDSSSAATFTGVVNAGTGLRLFTDGSGNSVISQIGQDKSMYFAGDDGGVGINALVLDMANGGAATFAGSITSGAITSRGDSGSDSIMRIRNTNSTSKTTRLQFEDSSGTVGDALIAYVHSDADSANHYLGMGVNNSTAFKIDNSDNATFAGKIEVGVFNQSQTNSGEAWIGRAADRDDGCLTIQLGGDSATGTVFEIVDRTWSRQIMSISGEAPASSFVINSSGNVGIGTGTPSYFVDAVLTNTGALTDFRLKNASTTNAASGARNIIQVANGDVGDPRLVLSIEGIQEYAIGIDNSADDVLKFNNGSDPSTSTNYFSIGAGAGGVVVNDGGDAAIDFRVESDSVTNMLFVNAGADAVGVRYDGWSGSSLSIKSTGSRSNMTLLEDENVGDGSYTPFYQYKVAYIAGNSSNTQLTIPFNARNYNQTGYLKIRVLPALHNLTTTSQVATAEFALGLAYPTTVSVGATLSSSGNFSSATGNSSNQLVITFTNNYSNATMSGAFVHIEFFGQQANSGGPDWANIAFN